MKRSRTIFTAHRVKRLSAIEPQIQSLNYILFCVCGPSEHLTLHSFKHKKGLNLISSYMLKNS